MKEFVATAKAVARHLFYSLGAYGLLKWLQRAPVDHLSGATVADRFSSIYAGGLWRHGLDSVPLSGHGSSLAATEHIRHVLPGLLRSLGARTLLDIGCGDYTWMSATTLPCQYIGADVVQDVVEANCRKYGSSLREFLCLDAIVDLLPEADVVLCREVIFHLSFEDGTKLLRNVLSTNCKYLICTTDEKTLFNSNIPTGDFRPLNMRRYPYNLPAPSVQIVDEGVVAGRRLAVWVVEELAGLNINP